MATASSSSSSQNARPSSSSSSVGGGSIRNYSNSIARRLNRVGQDEIIELAEVGERTIYVTDDGLIVSNLQSADIR